MKQKIINNKRKKNIAKIFLVFIFSFFIFSLSCNINGNIFNNTSAAPLDFLNNFKSPADLVLETTGDIAKNGLLLVFNYLLYGIWLLVSFFIWIAGMLFDWSINPVNINGIVGSDSVYAGWTIVRDFLNLSFILVLLFSAFATIFQIDKYHLMKKNILLMVVLMALLVNFSFPVARFIIDTTNVTMYFFVEQAFPGYDYTSSSISSHFLNKSNLVNLVIPDGKESVSGDANLTVKLLMLIVFSFLMAVTMIALAGIFLVRIIALAMIVIFAPLGFVGPIFPSFSKLGKWWDYLFNYALVGPVMMFMYLLALRLMESGIGGENIIGGDSLKRFSENYEVPGSSDFMATAASLIIPMIIMWISILMAGSMGIYGAGKITSFAKGVGNKFRKVPGRAIGWGLGVAGVSGGVKKATDEFKKTGTIFGKKPIPLYSGSEAKALREEKMGARMSRGKWSAGDEAQRDYERKKVATLRKEWKEDKVSDSEVRKSLQTGSSIEKKAAAMELAENKGFRDYIDEKGNKITAQMQFDAATVAVKGDNALKEILNSKVKEKRIDLIINQKAGENIKNKGIAPSNLAAISSERKNVAQKEFMNIKTDDWKKLDLENVLSDADITTGAMAAYLEHGDEGQANIRKGMSGTNLKAGKNNRMW
ncbi:MAG: hypothetical protein UR69_C0002G0045 [Candidatus Moranbacteria bacterium GW2011_GWE2_35_2-]|nr:MAG: hypothetical protein UR69_C0002G0045 [Candidatus Moranbacteria bacterium GW2011_GWE2_35_2-]KKQ22606.1 MAG: hypothetical protein US37_C0002G0231 [Candidatus Moranbacteria bacterium GW2011_GWF2_37_11]KKQ29009.1 MAG: hypothetical protein US44_C0004G0053 [Candidatus Moranbacteria bacterium GW2011_GWD1_37_17]KKQ30455.1 MAG: hypothetical protein US47_C0002G0045 [Candidatus Moranbacteria bacterium GW2011_GWE1_37_24]KKQ47936.1 MAG: hypothetical protein US66_C0004G0046 [Candidatus Moranbacteria 